MVFRLTIAATTLTTTTTMASSSRFNGERYKLLYKSKSGKSSSSSTASSKSVKSAVLGKSTKSVGEDSSSYSYHEDLEVNRPSFEPSNMETLLVSLDNSSFMVPSAMPSSLQPVVDDTHPPTALLGTTPSHQPIASPHVHDNHPTYSPTFHHHNLFSPPSVDVVDDDYHVDSSFVPSTTAVYHDPTVASRAPSSTSQPSDLSPLTNVPTVASFIANDSSMPPVIEGIFGPTPVEDSLIPPLSNEEDDTGIIYWPTLQPSPSSPFIGTSLPPTGNNEASFTFTVTLSSEETASIMPSSTPTSITSTLPSSNAPTSFQELNLLNPDTQEGQQPNPDTFQGAASLMVILACAMVIMGTLYGVFTIMKKDEESVLDEYGAQLAGAAAFDADDIGEVVNVVDGGGVDSHLQLVTD